jgi:hypothetical protein
MAKAKNIQELREQLLDAFEWIKGDPRRAVQVKEMANTAGKILTTVKLEAMYAMIRGHEPDIPFLGKTSGVPLKEHVRQLPLNS